MSWADCELGDVVTLKRGHDLPNGRRVQGVIPVVSSSGITGWHNEAKAEPPGVVTGRYGTIGEVFYLDRPYWPLNTALYAIDFHGNDPRFVAYFLRNHLRNYQSEKAAVPGVDRNVLHKMKVRCPDPQAQERIVSILSAYDDLIENNRRRIGLLEQAARLLYREWFVHFRFPGHETAKFVDGMPEGWERCAVDDLLILQRGFDLPVGNRKEGSVPVYGSTGIVGYHNEPKIPAPAIITGRSGSLGQVVLCDVPCWPLNTALWVKELKGVPASFAFFLLINLELSKYNGGASVPTLDRKVVHRLAVVRPAQNVLDQFDHMATTSFQTIAKLQKHNAHLTRARDLLLPRLMDGRIPV